MLVSGKLLGNYCCVGEKNVPLHNSFYPRKVEDRPGVPCSRVKVANSSSQLCKDLSSQRWQMKQRAAALWLRGIAGQPAQVGVKPRGSN